METVFHFNPRSAYILTTTCKGEHVMKKLLLAAAAMFAVGAVGQAPARATVLLNLSNSPVQADTPFSLPFTASGTSTQITIEGYQVPSFEQSEQNGVFLDDTGPNLLGGSWTLTPAAMGSVTNTFSDGSPVPALNFGAIVVGDYDAYSQTIVTIPGDSYSVNLLFTQESFGPSGFRVCAGPGCTVVPEPASLTLLGFALVGLAAIRRRLG
jgi:PEP-CTERM motif